VALSFDNIGIAVTDLSAASEFYRKLGFELTEADGAISAQNGSAMLYIFGTHTASSTPQRRLDMDGNAPGIDHISFWAADVDAIAAELTARGVEIESGPLDQSWGRRTVTVLDPDGNRLWFLGELKAGG
jgi:catechol 2,3-dioxygenase-like lactoylglutathione lyase family enzyme